MSAAAGDIGAGAAGETATDNVRDAASSDEGGSGGGGGGGGGGSGSAGGDDKLREGGRRRPIEFEMHGGHFVVAAGTHGLAVRIDQIAAIELGAQFAGPHNPAWIKIMLCGSSNWMWFAQLGILPDTCDRAGIVADFAHMLEELRRREKAIGRGVFAATMYI